MHDFSRRHIGPGADEQTEMLALLGYESLDQLAEATVPAQIRLQRPLKLPPALSEHEALEAIRQIASKNVVMRSMIGMGYYDTVTPPPILRNILENPGWYTQYTPYQAEISQGRLEALINFQTMIADLTALPLANASLLDEATAAAEAMAMAKSLSEKPGANDFIVAADCHPQTIAVVRGRASAVGINVRVGDVREMDFAGAFGVLVQYPTTDGRIVDCADIVTKAQSAGAKVVVAADLLALTLLSPPGEWGADICIGSAQRFGVPMGYGGPHAAFMSTRTEFARKMPGRLIGLSKDVHGDPAYRLTLQTREQHIRREKATSNICTAQVLLAVMASFYAVYHGPEGLKRIARRVHDMARALATGIDRLGHTVVSHDFFDTVKIRLNGLPADAVINAARAVGYNLRKFDDQHVGIACDETTDARDIENILQAFAGGATARINIDELVAASPKSKIENRKSKFLEHPVFHRFHAEHELLRYIHRLQSKDLSLTTSMIPLGSCTMKLNAAAEMLPITWPEFARLHPFAPADQAKGYRQLFDDLESWLAEITGFAATSLQPNAGSAGEYAGLLAIRAYHASRGEGHRTICLIPTSAHGTNPASAAMAGFSVVAVACDAKGNIDVEDLRAKASQHREKLGALMITYPSTHGVFEAAVKEICQIVHEHGGQVYMDGANMNAQVGLCRPGDIGADVCHLNLHKTFCIPHGGGGPGVGPICVAAHLKDFLPGIWEFGVSGSGSEASKIPVSAAPYGSAAILPISWMYIRMMGPDGLRRATQAAILNANYMAKRLEGHYPLLYTGQNGRVAHEFILDCRAFQQSAGVTVEDIAKRLMDYGFHAPTMSWPVAGTLMIEPTESESQAELDRFCEAMILIRQEIREIEEGKLDRTDNPLKNAPHTARAVSADHWPHPYPRQRAAYPAPWQQHHKFWPAVGRVDNPYGDRNLFCTCAPVDE
jgi:glycine dehydrogenase